MKARSGLEGLYERVLGWQIQHVPRHIAIIQDGNRRFARSLGLGTGEGHRAGADTTERVLDWAHEMGVKYITLYSFSTENFQPGQRGGGEPLLPLQGAVRQDHLR